MLATPARCWRCDHTIDPADQFCRACGEGQNASLAWYYRPLWIVVLTLTALGPFAVILIWRTPRLSPAAKWIASIAVIAVTVWIGWQLTVDVKTILDS